MPAKDSCTGGSIGIYKIQKLLQNCSNSEKINELNQWTVFNEIIVSKNSYIFKKFSSCHSQYLTSVIMDPAQPSKPKTG